MDKIYNLIDDEALLKESVSLDFDISNLLFKEGSLNPFKVKIDKQIQDLILNEIHRRYWIINVDFNNSNGEYKYYIMPRPVFSIKHKLPETIEEFEDLLYKPQLHTYNRNYKPLIHEWTRTHEWQLLTTENVLEILKTDFARKDDFYAKSYYNILINQAEIEIKKEKTDTEENNNTIKNKAIAKARAYFTNAQFLSDELAYYTKKNEDKTITRSESKMLSLLNWITYLLNLDKYAFTKDDHEKLFDALISLPVDEHFKWDHLNGPYSQFCLKTFNHQEILDRLYFHTLTIKDLIDHNIDFNKNIPEDKKIDTRVPIRDLAYNFFFLFKGSINTPNKTLINALYWDLYLCSAKAIPSQTKEEFYAEFLSYEDKLDYKKNTKNYKEDLKEFYYKYIGPLSLQLIDGLLFTYDQVKDEFKDADPFFKSHETRIDVYNLTLDYYKLKKEELTNSVNQLKAQKREISDRARNKSRSIVINDETEKTKALYEQTIRNQTTDVNNLEAKQNELKTSFVWSLDLNNNLYHVLNDLKILKSTTNSIKNFVIFDQTTTKIYATWEDVEDNTLSNRDMSLALMINFWPRKIAKSNANVTIFDPTLNITHLNDHLNTDKNGDHLRSSLFHGLDMRLMNIKHTYLLNAEYNTHASFNANHEVKEWKPEHAGWIGFLWYNYLLLNLSNQLLVVDDRDWDTSLNNNITLLGRIIANTMFTKSLSVSFVLFLGKGGEGKSTFKTLLRDALGAGNVYEPSRVMLKNANQFTGLGQLGTLAFFKDDAGNEQLTNDIDDTKSQSTIDYKIPVEHKGVDGLTYWPNFSKILIFANDIPMALADDPAMDRRLIPLKTASRQELMTKGLMQTPLYTMPYELVNSAVSYVLGSGLNTYINSFWDAKKNDKYSSCEKLLANTNLTSETKMSYGTSELEKYLISLILTYYERHKDSDGLTYLQAQSSKKTYIWLNIPTFQAFKDYEKWWQDRAAKKAVSYLSYDGFNKKIDRLMSKELWTKKFSVVYKPHPFYRTDDASLRLTERLDLLVLAGDNMQVIRNFALEQNCLPDEIAGIGGSLEEFYTNTSQIKDKVKDIDLTYYRVLNQSEAEEQIRQYENSTKDITADIIDESPNRPFAWQGDQKPLTLQEMQQLFKNGAISNTNLQAEKTFKNTFKASAKITTMEKVILDDQKTINNKTITNEDVAWMNKEIEIEEVKETEETKETEEVRVSDTEETTINNAEEMTANNADNVVPYVPDDMEDLLNVVDESTTNETNEATNTNDTNNQNESNT